MMPIQLNPRQLAELIRLYRRHEAWARRSGYAAMEWADFKRSRLANPLSRVALAKLDN